MNFRASVSPIILLCVLSVFENRTPLVGAESKAPGGTSRVLHIRCGYFSPGNPAWRPEHDDTRVTAGYGYSVRGRSYCGGGGYCWFFEKGSFALKCPKGVEGTLFLQFVDLSNNNRKQSVTVAGQYKTVVEDFPEPAGKWFAYKIEKRHTLAGRIDVQLERLAGANAVISRIDFVPAGMKDPLAPETDPRQITDPALRVEHDWRRQERLRKRPAGCHDAVADILARGAALVEDLRAFDALDTYGETEKKLDGFRSRLTELKRREARSENVALEWERLYLETRWVVRKTMFSHPALDFDELLFVKRITPPIGHQCSHHVGSAQRPGSDLCILKGLRPDGEVRSIVGNQLPVGAISRPDLSFDGKRIVFPYAAPRATPTRYPYGEPGRVGGACVDYQIYEVHVDSTGLRQLTRGPSENTEPCYLPGGRICFTSSRCHKFVQCGDWAIVFSLYSMNANGGGVYPITLAKEGEWFPSVLDDGRILYMRWEYAIKPFNTIQYLWSVHPDGTKPTLAYGDHFGFSPGPLSFIEARQIPGTSRIVATGAAHHNSGVGPIVIVDTIKSRGDPTGLVRVTPDVLYPETSEMGGRGPSRGGWYNAPYPLSETLFLVCYNFEPSDASPHGYGIYLLDIHGNKELVYRDRERSCYSPIPLRPRREPPTLSASPEAVLAKETPSSGTVVLLDVNEGLDGVARGDAKYLRILETISKHEHSIPQRLDVGIGSGWDPRRILGIVPIAEDGSAMFEVPADTALFFEVLDERYMDIRRMRSFVNVRPGETVTCVGCHEPYQSAPPNRRVQTVSRPAAKIAPPPWGAIPVSFTDVVQPVLDRRCASCHDGTKGEKKSFDLAGNKRVVARGADNQSPGPPWPNTPHLVTASFVNLLPFVDFTKLSGYGGGNLPLAPYAVGSHRSKLVKILDEDHYDVKLTTDEWRAIVAWIDCNAPFLGGWGEYVAGGK